MQDVYAVLIHRCRPTRDISRLSSLAFVGIFRYMSYSICERRWWRRDTFRLISFEPANGVKHPRYSVFSLIYYKSTCCRNAIMCNTIWLMLHYFRERTPSYFLSPQCEMLLSYICSAMFLLYVGMVTTLPKTLHSLVSNLCTAFGVASFVS